MQDEAGLAAERILGLHEQNTVNALKARLFAVGLIPTPTSRIDTVLIEDFEHYCQLVGHAAAEIQ